MFEFKSETVTIDGHTFVVREPSTAAIEAMAKGGSLTDFIGMCVTYEGKSLVGQDIPWRISSKLQEVLNKFSASGNESA